MYIFAWIAFCWCSHIITTDVYTVPCEGNYGLSLFSLCIQVLSYVLYIVHGTFVQDPSISVGMIPPLCQNLILIGMYLYYNRKRKEVPREGNDI